MAKTAQKRGHEKTTPYENDHPRTIRGSHHEPRRAPNQEVEEESIDFLKFVLDMEEDYVSQRLRERVPEQV